MTFAVTAKELHSVLSMEKMCSWLVAKGCKISWGTEREQVTDTSMHLPLNCSAAVISKYFLEIETNENIFLPETLFTGYLNSFGSHLWKRKLACRSKRYYFRKIYILFRPPRRTSRHHTTLLLSALSSTMFFLFYKMKQGTD